MGTRIAVVVAAASVVVATTALATTNSDDSAQASGVVGAGMLSAPSHGGSDDSRGPLRHDRMMPGIPGVITLIHPRRVCGEYSYLVEMVAHHGEAVASASELQRSDRILMRALGESIVSTQTAQIDQMQQWLSAWYPDRPRIVNRQPMMRDLTELSKNRLNRAFLRQMIPHHMAAVTSSQHMLAQDATEHRAVAAFARDVRDEQWPEIFLMRRWLRGWFGQDGCGGPGPKHFADGSREWPVDRRSRRPPRERSALGPDPRLTAGRTPLIRPRPRPGSRLTAEPRSWGRKTFTRITSASGGARLGLER